MNEKLFKAHCNKCNGDTNHSLLHEETQRWEEGFDIYSLSGGDRFEMLKCCGCDSIKLRHINWFSEATSETVIYYPPAISKHEPRWLSEYEGVFSSNEKEFANLLREVYSALHNDSRRLAVMGIRALVECVMISKVTDRGTFVKNLTAFQDAGFISPKQHEVIHSVLEAGHATIHRSFYPSIDDLHTVVEIAENLIDMIYIQPIKAAKLKDNVPKRGDIAKA